VNPGNDNNLVYRMSLGLVLVGDNRLQTKTI
jgi:hypothetical protein